MVLGKKEDKVNSYVPKDYADLYEYYIVGRKGNNSLCSMLLRSMLPHTPLEERDNLAHDVFVRLMETKQLEKFDPEKGNFGGVIFYTTRTIVVNFLDKRTRNPLLGLNAGSLVSNTPGEDYFEPGTYSLDVLFTVDIPKREHDIDVKKKIQRVYDFAADRHKNPKNKRDSLLLPLLNLLREERDPMECGVALGVTPSTIYNWVQYIRQSCASL